MKDFALTAAIGVGLIIGTGIAAHAGMDEPVHNHHGQAVLSTKQQQELFPKLRQLELDHIKANKQQLQTYESCVLGSSYFDRLFRCRFESFKTAQIDRQSFEASLRNLYKQYGISIPEGHLRSKS